jgi:ABC-type transport system involved in multi-copper enzyme maturation permease subunit
VTIVRVTLREAASRRLLLAVLILSGVFVALLALGFALAQDLFAAEGGDDFERDASAAVLTILGLYVASFLSAFLALFLSAGAVSSEIDSGQLHAVLARPLSRRSWLLQRWLGLAIVVVGYVVLLAGSVLLVARITTGYQAVRPLTGLGLMALQALTLLTLGVLGSTRLSTLANGAVVFFAFGLAWMSGLIEFLGGVLDNVGMERVGVITSLLIPSDALWRGASAGLASPAFLAAAGAMAADDIGGFPFAGLTLPSPALLTWSLLYVPALLLLAVRTFTRRDL